MLVSNLWPRLHHEILSLAHEAFDVLGCTERLLHAAARYRAQVRRKVAAYERHIQIGLIVQGLLHYLAVFHHRAVWCFFGSWLRTADVNAAPSEMVVAHALRRTFPHFLRSLPTTDKLVKFLAPKLDPQRSPSLGLFPLDQAA